MQSKLLRVLEDWTFKRVGGTRDITVDVHLIAASNQDLEARVAEKRFRDDLFYRLNVFPIKIPPLRQRPQDIAKLAEYFLAHFNRKFGKKILGFSQEAIQILLSYSWPGNVRELRNVIERAMILQREPIIDSIHLTLGSKASQSTGDLLPGIMSLPEAEKLLIVRALSITHGNVVRAAHLL